MATVKKRRLQEGMRRAVSCFVAAALAVMQVAPASLAFAADNAPDVLAAGVVSTQEDEATYAVGAQFTTDDSPFNFTVLSNNGNDHTCRIGISDAKTTKRGNGLKDDAYPQDHKIVIPKTVTAGNIEWSVVEIGRYAFASALGTPVEQKHIEDVTIYARLNYIGAYAFATYLGHNTVNIHLEEGASIASVSPSIFNQCKFEELSFPEGVGITSRDYDDLQAQLHVNGSKISVLNLPMSFNGDIKQYISALTSLRVLSPYATFVQNKGLEEGNNTFPTSFSLLPSAVAPVVYVWADSESENSFNKVDAYKNGSSVGCVGEFQE